MCDDIYSKTISCEDIETTVSLPIELPECKSSKTFEEYANVKESSLAEIIENMIINVNEINMTTEKELENINAFAIEELKWMTEGLNYEEQEEMASIEQMKTLLKQNKKISTKLMNLVDEYDSDLKSLEKRRTNLLQEIVSNQFYEISKSGSEYGKQKIGEIIFQLNKDMFNNIQRNEDLKLKLKVEGQEKLKECNKMLKNKILRAADKHAQHLWNLLKIKQEKRNVIEVTLSLKQEKSKTREEFLQIANNLISDLTKFTEVLELPAVSEVSEGAWKQWIDDLYQMLEMLQSFSKNVEGLLKTAVSTLLESFDQKVNMLTRNITLLSEDRKLSKDFRDEIQKLKANQREELNHLLESWHNIIIVLKKRTERTKGFLVDLTSLWTNHMSRMDVFNKNVEETLKSTAKQSEKEDTGKVTKLKSQIKSLREAKDLLKLEQQYSTLQTSFDDIYKSWKENIQSRLQLIDEIEEKDIGRLIEEQKNEVLHFLQVKYPKCNILSDEFSPKLKTFSSEYDKQIAMCNAYMSAVDHRTLALYEMLEQYIPMSKDVIRKQINYCLEMKKIDVVNEFENKVTLIQELRNKTLEETKQIRYAELEIHSERLVSHSRAVKLIFENLNKQYNELKLNQQRKLAEFSEKLKETSDKVSLHTSQHLKSVVNDLETEWTALSESLLNDITNYKPIVEEALKRIQNSNAMFRKIPKVFKKGGNYSPEEVKTLNRELKKLDKLFKSQQKTIMNNCNGLIKDVSQNILDDKLKFIKDHVVKRKMEDDIIDMLTIIRQRLALEIKTVESSKQLLGLNIYKLSNLQELDENVVFDIFEKAVLLCDNLLFPKGILNLECSKESSINSSNIPSKSGSQKQSNCAVFTLFINTNGIITNESDKFLSHTKGLLLDRFSRLVKLIEDTYQVKETSSEKKPKSTTLNKKKEPKKESVPDEVAAGVGSIKTTLLSYNRECELFWLQKVPTILYDINSFQTITVSLVENKLSSIHGDYMSSLKELENSYDKKIEEYFIQGVNEREATQKSLVLPLAHPTHHGKLKELHNKVLNLAQDQKTHFKKEFDDYKECLQNYHNNYVERLKELKETLNEVQSRIHNGETFEKLIQDYKSVIVNMPSESKVLSENGDIDSKGVVEKLSNPINQDENPKYPQSIWSDNDCLQEEFNDKTFESSQKEENKIFRIELPEKSINIKKIATNYLKESAERIQALFDKAKFDLSENEAEIGKWVQSFESSMGHAKNIFSNICK